MTKVFTFTKNRKTNISGASRRNTMMRQLLIVQLYILIISWQLQRSGAVGACEAHNLEVVRSKLTFATIRPCKGFFLNGMHTTLVDARNRFFSLGLQLVSLFPSMNVDSVARGLESQTHHTHSCILLAHQS
jgi:hypothetical protein